MKTSSEVLEGLLKLVVVDVTIKTYHHSCHLYTEQVFSVRLGQVYGEEKTGNKEGK